MPEEGAKAVLAIGRRSVIGRMIDQSAGGFSIQYRGRPRVRPGKSIKLRTNAGWCEATVVRIERIGRDTRLGLQRERDLADPRAELLLSRRSLPPLFKSSHGQSSTGSLGMLLRITLAGTLGFWVATAHPVWLSTVSEWMRSRNWSSILARGTSDGAPRVEPESESESEPAGAAR